MALEKGGRVLAPCAAEPTAKASEVQCRVGSEGKQTGQQRDSVGGAWHSLLGALLLRFQLLLERLVSRLQGPGGQVGRGQAGWVMGAAWAGCWGPGADWAG